MMAKTALRASIDIPFHTAIIFCKSASRDDK